MITKGNDLKAQIGKGAYPGIRKTTLDGVNQVDYLTGKSEKSAREVFYYFSGATPSALPYKNRKMYYAMSEPGPAGWIMPLVPFHFTLLQNILRDPFEQAVGIDQKTARSIGGGNRVSIDRLYLRLEPASHWPTALAEWFETLKAFPPLQAPASYNLTKVMEQLKSSGNASD